MLRHDDTQTGDYVLDVLLQKARDLDDLADEASAELLKLEDQVHMRIVATMNLKREAGELRDAARKLGWNGVL